MRLNKNTSRISNNVSTNTQKPRTLSCRQSCVTKATSRSSHQKEIEAEECDGEFHTVDNFLPYPQLHGFHSNQDHYGTRPEPCNKRHTVEIYNIPVHVNAFHAELKFKLSDSAWSIYIYIHCI